MRIQETTPRGKAIFRRINIRELDYSQREYEKNVLVVGDGGDGENSPAMWRRCARENRVHLREGRKEQLTMDDGGMDSRGYRVPTVRQNMGRMFWWWGDGGDSKNKS
jgi:hypothetical protein